MNKLYTMGTGAKNGSEWRRRRNERHWLYCPTPAAMEPIGHMYKAGGQFYRVCRYSDYKMADTETPYEAEDFIIG